MEIRGKIKLKKYYVEKPSKTPGKEIQIQHWGGHRKLSMDVIAVEYAPNSVDTGRNKTKS